MHEIATFLAGHPPFDTLDADELATLVASCEIEFIPAGATVVAQESAPADNVRVIRRGSVELHHNGRVVDLLGEGEMFGHTSMLTEIPTAHAVVAHEDTLCYRFPAGQMRPVLGRPAALRFLVRSLSSRFEMQARERSLAVPLDDPSGRPVGEVIPAPPIVAGPDESVREAARRMVEVGSSSLLVDAGDSLGIVTDRDLRRVVASGGAPDTPVSQIMTVPAHTIRSDTTCADALLEMLDRNIHHLPVVDGARRVIGVIGHGDLMAIETRTPFHLRRAIAGASTLEELIAATVRLPGTVIELHDARVVAATIGRVIATVHDAATRRMIELALDELGDPPAPFTWFALGSIARREAFPSSDQDSALAWAGADEGDETRAAMLALAGRVVEGVTACGLPPCKQGAIASRPLFARSLARWTAAMRSLLDDPDQEKALILISVVVDGRPIWDASVAAPQLAGLLTESSRRPLLLRRLAIFALAHRPPTGFFRDFVVEHGGERKGTFNIKQGGLLPVVDLARWAAMSAGAAGTSTVDRLAAAEAAGTLTAAHVATLRVAYDLFTEMRMHHQVEQLREGVEPDDQIDPRLLEPLTRRYLKEAFRAVTDVQRGIASEIGLRPR